MATEDGMATERQDGPMFTEADLISEYSRRQAIEDGVLVDVTKAARETGFRVSVVLTSHVWERCVSLDGKPLLKGLGQDERGRLHDVLWMAYLRARIGVRISGDRGTFRLTVLVQEPGNKVQRVTEELVLAIGPVDEWEPVATIMYAEDD